MIQRVLGSYRLLNVVHTGQACQLWQAYDDGRQCMIAVKAVMTKAAMTSEHIGYLRHEFKVGQEIKHPRTIEIFRFDIDRGTPYLAMEWYAAPNLKRRMRSKEERDRLFNITPTIVDQAAEALAWMHGKGWVHRDIKPDNFLVADDGQVKLIDFGLAIRPAGWLAKILPVKPKRQGTPSYMSPEQIRCGLLDQRADVYSFACTIYELVAGTPPYTGSTREELFSKHLKAALPALEAANQNITSDFAKLIRKCLAKDPSARPASAQEFLDEFRKMRMFRVFPRRSESPAT